MGTKHPTVIKSCEACGTSFTFRPWPSAVKRGHGRFCSFSCATRVPLDDRFFSRIGRKTETGCILWNGSLRRDGYGQIGEGPFRGKKFAAHRIAFILLVGPIPEGLYVLHRCDNPPCINPTHLFLGTTQDNTKDRVAKGRTAKGEEKHGKLRTQDVREILMMLDAGHTLARIGNHFGVSFQTIFDIKSGDTWKHLSRLPKAVKEAMR